MGAMGLGWLGGEGGRGVSGRVEMVKMEIGAALIDRERLRLISLVGK